MAPPSPYSIAQPCIQPWRDVHILRVPLPTSAAASAAPSVPNAALASPQQMESAEQTHRWIAARWRRFGRRRRPREHIVARPLIQPWQEVDIIQVPLPTAAAMLAVPVPPLQEAQLAGPPAACGQLRQFLRVPAAGLCGLLAATQLAAAPGAQAMESAYPQLPFITAAAAAAPQRPATVAAFSLAEAPAAPAPAATPEQQAAFEEAQAITGQKWLAYLAAWSAWLAWDLYRQNSQKAAGEQQGQQAEQQQGGAPAAGSSEGGPAESSNAPRQE
ncbi:hypothetical protein C2E21_7815 [Chlorella sorokiniana]|uniref:Uncharacterized protein n=1 Tax=Chlorella sorokiniana TaxID=3076 RepID=A0A2P6TGE8_CHLSO|nr:hypothetical protein C2E21_7815 [Chlorella sorokiniana]|eukprot:PRW33186.1 hypothetical protein C2E21_7815 [Chlorella sorokiniana]